MLKNFINPLKVFTRNYQLKTTTHKIIDVYPPREPVTMKTQRYRQFVQKDVERLDPSHWRRDLLSAKTPQTVVRTGDIVRVVYHKRPNMKMDDLYGYVLGINKKQHGTLLGSSLLLRNHFAKTAVEVRVPVFSPLIERIDIIKRPERRRRRNKHYYIRDQKTDVGNIEGDVKRRRQLQM